MHVRAGGYKRLGFIGSLAFAVVSAIVACSSSDSSSVTLENVCDLLPKRYCAQDHPCCETAGYGFDEAHCEDSYRTFCGNGFAAVAKNRAVFHPEKIDACIAGYQPYEDKCVITPADYAAAQSVSACYQVFEGTVATGDPCDSSTECAAQQWPDVAYCDVTCKVLHSGQEGDTCGSAADSVRCNPLLRCDSTHHCVAAAGPHYIVNKDSCAGKSGTGGPDGGGAGPFTGTGNGSGGASSNRDGSGAI